MINNPHNIDRLTFEDKEIILLGTAHVSKESARLVDHVIASEKPDTVCVELCEARFQSIRQKDMWLDKDIIKVIKEKKSFLLLSICALTLVLLAGTVFSQTESIQIKVSPSTIVIGSDVTWVTVHTDIPLRAVDCSTVTLNSISVAWTKADAKGNLVAKFNFNKIENIVAPPKAILTLRGFTKDSIPFAGSDTVVVRKDGPKK